MNYWCNTCGCYKGAQGADECAVDNHAIVAAKDREVKVSAAKPTLQGREWIASKVEAERKAFQEEIAELKKVIHEVHGTLDAVLHAADPQKAMKAWIPIAMRDCRKAMGLPVEAIPPLSEEDWQVLEKIGFKLVPAEPPKPKPKGEWIPKIGDRVWVSGKTWSCEGTITGFAKDDPSVPWIKVDKDGSSWDARDLGSVRRLEDK